MAGSDSLRSGPPLPSAGRSGPHPAPLESCEGWRCRRSRSTQPARGTAEFRRTGMNAFPEAQRQTRAQCLGCQRKKEREGSAAHCPHLLRSLQLPTQLRSGLACSKGIRSQRNETQRNAGASTQPMRRRTAKKSQCARPTVADESTMGERTRTPEAFEGGTTGDTHRSHGMQVGLGLAGHLRRCYKLRLQRKRRL